MGRRAEAAADFDRALAILEGAGLGQPYAECRQLRDRVLGRASEASGSIA
jgi:hypothetical protein